jgi:hypothetical protein
MSDSSKESKESSCRHVVSRRTFLETAAGLLAAYPTLRAQTGRVAAADAAGWQDRLAEGFHAPPRSAKPWVFWLWSEYDNKDGITKDLEALKRQGVGGIMFGDGGVGQLSQPWSEGFSYLVREAGRLGLDFNANIANGFGTGGTWATADVAAKKLVYSETQVDGPRMTEMVLPVPLLVDGYYRDVAVLAFREHDKRPVTPLSVTASSTLGGYVDEWNWPAQFVIDRDPDTYWKADPALTPTKEKPAWLDFQFSEPLLASGLYVASAAEGGPQECELQAQGDDGYFRSVLSFAMEKGQAKRLRFSPTSASRFRLLIQSAYVADVQISEAWLLREGDEPYLRHGLKWWPFKSGNRSFWDYPKQGPAVLQEEYTGKDFDVPSAEVLDLAGNMDGHGRLAWQAPPGRWTILRFGYTLLGTPPRSSCEPGFTCGYELDLFKASSADANLDTVVKLMLAEAGTLTGATFSGVHIDSHEYGVSEHGQLPTWTDEFREEFRQRRGYDLLAYLPTLARRIVDSREVSNRFLWDYRRTMGDLYSAFYARLQGLVHQHGLKTNHENGYGTYPFPHIDGLEAFGRSDVPQGEFWTATPIMSQFYHFCDSVRTAASAAHIYGKPLVQSEAFSTWLRPYECYPGVMKRFGDQAFSDGLQQCVIFCSTNQPEEIPGADEGGYEIINRHITWQKQSKAFFDYLARSQYLLQQGQFAADAIYYYGEGSTKFVPGKEFLKPALPAGYDFDGLNAEVLLNRLSAKPGGLVLPDGMSYRLLVLPEDREMSLPVLRKIRELIEAGALVLGNRPLRATGLTGYPQSDEDVRRLADEMWGPEDTAAGDRRLGQGRLVWGKDPANLLAEMNISPDFEVSGEKVDSRFVFTHRRLEGTDIYFVANQHDVAVEVQCKFRISGRQPEIWDPVTGRNWDATDFRQENGQTVAPMTFAPYQSFFVIFHRASAEPKVGRPNFPVILASVELRDPWTIHFDPKWGGPESVVFERLEDWTKRPEEGIKYYSGTATYRKTFDLPRTLSQARSKILLDLGEMKNLAEVRLNDKDLGVLWTKPFRVDITEALQSTGNVLEIDVVNLWTNRLIGDAALPPEKRFTQSDASHIVKKDDPPLESGLLGPVRLLAV